MPESKPPEFHFCDKSIEFNGALVCPGSFSQSQRVLHVLLKHQSFKCRRQDGGSCFQNVAQALGRDFQADGRFRCGGGGAPDAALQHGLLTKRIACLQSGKDNTGVFVTHVDAARLNEVELVRRGPGFEEDLSFFELYFVKGIHINTAGGVSSLSVRMTVDFRMPRKPGGMFLTILEIEKTGKTRTWTSSTVTTVM